MPQLVGTTCVLCQQRIGSVLTGKFCETCGNAVHTKCVDDRAADAAEGRCAACGGDPVAALAAKKREEDFHAADWRRDMNYLRIGRRVAFSTFRGFRFIIAGVPILGLGIWLCTNPQFRDDPKHVTFRNLLPGMTACFVGVALFVLGAVYLRDLWRDPRG